MKKLFLLLFVLLLIQSVHAESVAYIVKSSANPSISSVLDEMGYNYTVITDSQIPSADFSKYDMLLVWNEKLTNYAKVPVTQKKSLVANYYHVNNWKIASYAGKSSWSGYYYGKVFTNNSITKNISSPVKLFNSPGITAYKLPNLPNRARGIINVLSTNDASSYSIIGAISPGGILYPSGTASARTLFFGITETSYWTSDTRQMFKNSLIWVINGDDKDGDGFYSDSDCNDNNASLWQYIPGYLDSDRDGFGAGSLLQVCSGNSLAPGYSAVSGDCVDNNASINPNAIEIAYDNVDNDCKNGDLADVDNDGYCKKEYWIQDRLVQCIKETGSLGTDCDESNSGINPSAVEIIDNIDQNCRNDDPVLTSNIPNLSWNEDENASINLKSYFADPEGDNLTFSVNKISDNNVSVTISNSVASFSPKPNWNGKSAVSFYVSDGNGGSVISNNVTLTVLAVNDAPKLENISDISVVEGQKIRIITNASDVEGDMLSYAINDSRFSQVSTGIFEWQTNIGNVGIYYVSVSVSDGKLSESKQFKITILKKIVINEFLVNPSSGNEWVEIYNPGNSDFSLTGCYLEDLSMNHIQLTGVILSKGFVVKEMSNILDDSGDTIKLKCSDLLDEVSYGTGAGKVSAPTEDESAGRINDGVDTDSANDWKIFENPTKGLSNSADVVFPTVSLISPVNNTEINSSYVLFNYTASDNLASVLNCSFYSNVKGSFAKLVSDSINNGSMGNFNANGVENGNYIWQIRCSDGRNEASSEIWSFKVNSPKAPVIQAISNITTEENQEARIVVNASDANGDELTYSVNDSRFIQDETNKNIFTWKTGYNDAGTYYVKVSVSDGTLTAYQNVKVVVNNFNRAPVMQEIGNKIIDEDTRTSFLVYASDEDGDSLSYRIKEKDTSKVNCEISGNNLNLIGASNFYGDASCVIEVSDGKLADSKKVNIIVLNVNDAPVIDSYSPLFNPIISKRASQTFSIAWHDVDNADDSVVWYLDNNIVGSGNSNSYTYAGNSGNFEVRAVVSDSIYSSEKIWNLSVVEKPQTTKYNGNTTDFSGMNDSEIGNVKLILEKTGIGKIEFLEPADLSYAVDFDHYSDIQTGLAAIDTNYLSMLAGKIARVTLYGLGFDKMPVIYYDSGYKTDRTQINNLCPENVCQNAVYENGTLSFSSHFSSFRIGDTLTCSQQSGDVCSASEICTGNWLSAVEDKCCSVNCQPNFSRIMCSNLSSNVQVEIRDPDEGDDFNVGDDVNLKVRVYNELEKSQSFDVEAYLYDLTDNVKIDSYDKSVRVKKDDREDVEFTISLDSGLDESHSYAIFVRAEDDYCNQDYVKINIDRNEHDVKITDFNLPEIVNCGEEFEARVSVENVGYNDEDVSLELLNSELRINEKMGFNLESSGGSDKKTKVLSLFVPDYSEEKSYSVKARVDFSGETTSLEREITVNCAKQETEIVRDTNIVSLNGNQIKSMNKQSLTDKINNLSPTEMVIIIADMFILLGIIFIILFLILRR